MSCDMSHRLVSDLNASRPMNTSLAKEAADLAPVYDSRVKVSLVSGALLPPARHAATASRTSRCTSARLSRSRV